MFVRTVLRPVAMALAALSVISCATDGPLAPDNSNAALPPAPTIDAPDQSLLGGLLGGTVTLVDNTLTTTVNTVDGLLHLLTCSALPDDQSTQWIGPNGGTIKFGASQLSIPRGALKSYVQITAEQVSGDVNSVRFSPEGLKFAKPATLTMGYSNCQQVQSAKQIVYTDESLNVLEVLKSKDSSRGETVTAPVNHFSRYAVSW
ncbi:MAG TPA: hypothetical protein VFL88_01435 [Gemmatimonadales bacterium]|nr:hypothetical protein [Gemmatimonadales bacterium]